MSEAQSLAQKGVPDDREPGSATNVQEQKPSSSFAEKLIGISQQVTEGAARYVNKSDNKPIDVGQAPNYQTAMSNKPPVFQETPQQIQSPMVNAPTKTVGTQPFAVPPNPMQTSTEQLQQDRDNLAKSMAVSVAVSKGQYTVSQSFTPGKLETAAGIRSLQESFPATLTTSPAPIVAESSTLGTKAFMGGSYSVPVPSFASFKKEAEKTVSFKDWQSAGIEEAKRSYIEQEKVASLQGMILSRDMPSYINEIRSSVLTPSKYQSDIRASYQSGIKDMFKNISLSAGSAVKGYAPTKEGALEEYTRTVVQPNMKQNIFGVTGPIGSFASWDIIGAEIRGDFETARQLKEEMAADIISGRTSFYKGMVESPAVQLGVTGLTGGVVGAGIRAIGIPLAQRAGVALPTIAKASKYAGIGFAGIGVTGAGLSIYGGETQAEKLERFGMIKQAARARARGYGGAVQIGSEFGAFAVGAGAGYKAGEKIANLPVGKAKPPSIDQVLKFDEKLLKTEKQPELSLEQKRIEITTSMSQRRTLGDLISGKKPVALVKTSTAEYTGGLIEPSKYQGIFAGTLSIDSGKPIMIKGGRGIVIEEIPSEMNAPKSYKGMQYLADKKYSTPKQLDVFAGTEVISKAPKIRDFIKTKGTDTEGVVISGKETRIGYRFGERAKGFTKEGTAVRQLRSGRTRVSMITGVKAEPYYKIEGIELPEAKIMDMLPRPYTVSPKPSPKVSDTGKGGLLTVSDKELMLPSKENREMVRKRIAEEIAQHEQHFPVTTQESRIKLSSLGVALPKVSDRTMLKSVSGAKQISSRQINIPKIDRSLGQINAPRQITLPRADVTPKSDVGLRTIALPAVSVMQLQRQQQAQRLRYSSSLSRQNIPATSAIPVSRLMDIPRGTRNLTLEPTRKLRLAMPKIKIKKGKKFAPKGFAVGPISGLISYIRYGKVTQPKALGGYAPYVVTPSKELISKKTYISGAIAPKRMRI